METPSPLPAHPPTVTIFGGSGFIGRYVVALLAKQGYRIRVAVRDRAAAGFLQPLGEVGQILPLYAPVQSEQAVREVTAGATYVINLVAVLADSRQQSFASLHARAPETIAQAAKAEGVAALVHVSALGADLNSVSAYARTKAEGEHRLLRAYRNATILRPSVVFGVEDQFLNRFARIARLLPVMPLLGSGQARLQPLFVEDVAQAIVNSLQRPEAAGRVYELAGPNIYRWQELMRFIVEATGLRRALLPIPMPLLKLQAGLLERLPGQILTRDQLRLVEMDNIASGTLPGLADLGITASPMEAIARAYLARG